MKQPKPKKPLGNAIHWTSEDIEHMSQITATDKKAAQALWHNEAPAKFKTLVNAQVEEAK
jgi:hypothetical protein